MFKYFYKSSILLLNTLYSNIYDPFSRNKRYKTNQMQLYI